MLYLKPIALLLIPISTAQLVINFTDIIGNDILDENMFMQFDSDLPILDDIDEKKFSGLIDMTYNLITTSLSLSEFKQKIQYYGCHCWPNGKNEPGGKGTPIDAIDSVCRKNHRCKQCVDIDYPGQCDTNQGRYRWKIENNEIICDSANSPCQNSQCLCDKDFAENIALHWDDATYNPFYWKHPTDNTMPVTFNREGTCSVSGIGYELDACCGEKYPQRYPYSTKRHDCCQSSGKLFDPSTFQCCSDGKVRPSC